MVLLDRFPKSLGINNILEFSKDFVCNSKMAIDVLNHRLDSTVLNTYSRLAMSTFLRTFGDDVIFGPAW